MAKSLVTEDFHAKFKGWKMTTARDEKNGRLVTTVGMPQLPGLDIPAD